MDSFKGGRSLSAINSLLHYYSTTYSKTFVVIFGLNFPMNRNYPENNTVIKIFMDRFTKHLEHKKLRPLYLWVREQASSHNHHYHIMVILDGQKIDHKYKIMTEAKRIWESIVGVNAIGLVDYRWEPWMIRRDDPNHQQVLDHCLQACRYLAKEYSKDQTPHGYRNWGSSNLKKLAG